jgi:hypothetical protein
MNPGVGNPNILRPEGPADPDVSVLAVESLDGHPICVLGNYALHYVGGVGPGHISADYFAIWADTMARLAGLTNSGAFPPFVGMLTNACSGHGISFDARVSQPQYRPYEKMRWVADVLAAEAYRTWRTLKFHDWVELGASVEELELGVRLPSGDDVAAARKILAAAPKGGQLKTPIQALRIGALGIATYPGEAFAELGLEVKAKSAFKPTMLIELANDYRGYIPTPQAHENGGYETWRAKSSYLEVQAAPKMVAAALRQLAKLA